ncbi:MAG: TonB-dependent Receptor Plug Domain [Phenylobacterium sp.]|nr:TonB-dependent Receptor Plug Domain [Phenylobacterium sp.]
MAPRNKCDRARKTGGNDMSGALARMLSTTAFSVLAVLIAPVAHAQTAPPPPAPSGGGGAQLEEVVVTAQRRTENLQNVPLSVVAVGGEQLRRNGIQTIESLNRLAPNAVIERVGLFPGAASLSMRGIGYSGIESFTDPDVAVYVNGIYQARNATALSQALDVSSIEVLRGPQGTLYGRNAYAGAISVVTNRPNMTNLEGTGVATIGNKGLRDFDLIGNVPIVHDVLAARIAMRSHNLDGLWKNNGLIRGVVDSPLAGRTVGAEKSFVIRPSLRYTPNERWDIQFIGEFLREDDQAAPIASLPIVPNAASPTGFTPSSIVGFGGYQHNPFGDKRLGIPSDGTDPYTTGYSLGDKPMKFDQDTFTLDASYDTGFGRLRFLGNHQTTKSDVWADTDGSVANIFSSGRWENYKGDSAELQFVSKFNFPLDIVAGLFAFHDQYKTTQLSFTNNNANFPDQFNQANYLRLAPGGTTATCNASLALAARTGCLYPFYVISYINNGGKRTAYAAYIQGEYHVTPQLGVVLGVRYSYEKKFGYYGSNTELGTTGLSTLLDPASHALPTTPGQVFTVSPLKNDSWSPRVGVNYKLTSDIFLFAFWQRAFKSGGFNANSADRTAFQTPYGPETVDNFEGGVKSEFFDHKLRVNVQAFYAKYKDLQRSQVVASPTASSGVTTVVTNNADVTSYGVEAEIAARPMEGLTLFTNIGWDHAAYTRYCFDFNGAEATPTPAIDTTHQVCGPVVPVVLANGTTQFLVPQDYSSNRPLRAPRWDITAGFTKEFPLEFGRLALTGSVNYRSDVETDLANRPFSFRPSMTVVDATFGFTPNNGRYTVSVWGHNLNNDVEILGYTPVGSTFAFGAPTQPRTFGVTATVNF